MESEEDWTLRQDTPGFWSIKRLLTCLLALMGCMALAIGILFHQQGVIRQAQTDGEQRGYQNRAAAFRWPWDWN